MPAFINQTDVMKMERYIQFDIEKAVRNKKRERNGCASEAPPVQLFNTISIVNTLCTGCDPFQ